MNNVLRYPFPVVYDRQRCEKGIRCIIAEV